MIPGNRTLIVRTSTPGARNAEGNVTYTYTDSAPISGFLRQKLASELVNGVYMTVEKWVAVLPFGTVVDHKSTIVDENGVEYRVNFVAPHYGVGPTSAALNHVTATCSKAGA